VCVALVLWTGCDARERGRVVGADGREAIELELWTLSLKPRFNDYMNDLIARFEAGHPGVKVKWVDVPFEALARKLTAAAAARRAPDVVNLSAGDYARFVALGGLRDISRDLPGDPQQTYFPGVLGFGRIGGGLYCVPWYLATQVTYANAALLNPESGVTPDTLGGDWDTVLRQAEAYHRRTGRFLFCPILAAEDELVLHPMEDGLMPLKPGPDGALVSNLSDPAVVACIERWVRLYRAGVFPREAATGGHATQIESYQNGQVALLFTGPQMLERVRQSAPDVFANTVVRPMVAGTAQTPGVATMVLSVMDSTPHPKEAAALAWFVTNADNQLRFAKTVSILPSTPAAMDDPHFAAPPVEARSSPDGKVAYARYRAAEELKRAVAYVPALPAWPRLKDVFNERIKACLLDGRDVRQTLEEVGREWDQILKQFDPVTADALPRIPGATPTPAAPSMN
jgi:putative chitobiose transport system substrate-binding protein